MNRLTRDTFLNGRLTVLQMRDGYRFSIDAVLLAATVHPKAGDRILDLGTGCGIIPMILACRYPRTQIHGVEVQSALADLARHNVSANRLEGQVAIIHGDMRSITPKQIGDAFDWVVSNPPYRAPLTGRINPDTQKALARHEIKIDLDQLIAAAKRMLRTGGRLATIFNATRTVDLLAGMRAAGIEPKWMQSVQSHGGQGAKLVLVSAIKGGRPGLTWAPPLVVYREDGSYADAVQAMMTKETPAMCN